LPSQLVGAISEVFPLYNPSPPLSFTASPEAEDPKVLAWRAKKGFHKLPLVAAGARVVFTVNSHAASGRCNSAFATVASIQSSPALGVQRIHVHLDKDPPGKLHAISRSKTETTYIKSCQYHKFTYPLQLAYAITGHRCQGSTLKGVTVLHMREALAPGLLYVMLSRVTSRVGLVVLGPLTPEMFVPVVDPTMPNGGPEPTRPNVLDTFVCQHHRLPPL